jgi:hypothetical protein
MAPATEVAARIPSEIRMEAASSSRKAIITLLLAFISILVEIGFAPVAGVPGRSTEAVFSVMVALRAL